MIAAWAFEKDSLILMDAIDAIKGSGYCEKKWVEKMKSKMTEKELKEKLKHKKFWKH